MNKWIKALYPKTDRVGKVVMAKDGAIVIQIECPCCGKRFEITTERPQMEVDNEKPN